METIMIIVPRSDSLRSKESEHLKRTIIAKLTGVGFVLKVTVDRIGKQIVEKYMERQLSGWRKLLCKGSKVTLPNALLNMDKLKKIKTKNRDS